MWHAEPLVLSSRYLGRLHILESNWGMCLLHRVIPGTGFHSVPNLFGMRATLLRAGFSNCSVTLSESTGRVWVWIPEFLTILRGLFSTQCFWIFHVLPTFLSEGALRVPGPEPLSIRGRLALGREPESLGSSNSL